MSSRRSSSSIRWLSIACTSSDRAHRRAKSDLQDLVLHPGALRWGVEQQARQDEVTAPAANLQHELVGLTRQADLFFRGEGQLDRQNVAAPVASDRVGP